uniref:Fibronectin type-III domain-containing protein n=1 Tax=Amphimedon queenslandica TaxID=400682 RepID=A0A1X7TW32_AMPQE
LLLVPLALLSVVYGEIIVPPQSLNTTVGSNAPFTCVASNTLVLGWTINGLPAITYNAVPNDTHNSLVYTSLLTVNATETLNGSIITCLAVSSYTHKTTNVSAILLVQGLLEPVHNLTVLRTNSSFINISFISPHTLLNVPITSYHLQLNGVYTNTTETYVLSNTTLSSLIPLPYQCELYRVSVTAQNGAGYSNNATRSINIIEAPHIEADTVQLFIYKSSVDSLPQVNISFKIVQPNCGSWLPHHVKINTGDHTHSFGPLPLKNGFVELVLHNLTENRFYQLVMWDENGGGVSNTANATISSFGVQNVSVNSPQKGVLCISCSFMKGSSDVGCYAELSHTVHTTGYTAVHISRGKGEESASGCVTKLEEGLYNIAVYDVETNGERGNAAVTLSNITINNNNDDDDNNVVTATVQSLLPSPTMSGPVSSPSVSGPTTTGEVSGDTFSIQPFRDAAIGIGILLILMIIILSILIIYQLRRNRQRKVWETERDHGTMRRSNSFQPQPTNEYECRPVNELEREVTPSTVTSDETSPSLAPPPAPPPSSLNTSSPSTVTTDLPSPDSQSDTGLILRDNSNSSVQPQTTRSSLRPTPVLSAWAAVNQLASLPVADELSPPPSYESALNIATEPFDRPQSVIIPSRLNVSSEATPPLSARLIDGSEYAQLDFPSSPLPPPPLYNDENCWYNPRPVTMAKYEQKKMIVKNTIEQTPPAAAPVDGNIQVGHFCGSISRGNNSISHCRSYNASIVRSYKDKVNISHSLTCT